MFSLGKFKLSSKGPSACLKKKEPAWHSGAVWGKGDSPLGMQTFNTPVFSFTFPLILLLGAQVQSFPSSVSQDKTNLSWENGKHIVVWLWWVWQEAGRPWHSLSRLSNHPVPSFQPCPYLPWYLEPVNPVMAFVYSHTNTHTHIYPIHGFTFLPCDESFAIATTTICLWVINVASPLQTGIHAFLSYFPYLE